MSRTITEILRDAPIDGRASYVKAKLSFEISEAVIARAIKDPELLARMGKAFGRDLSLGWLAEYLESISTLRGFARVIAAAELIPEISFRRMFDDQP